MSSDQQAIVEAVLEELPAALTSPNDNGIPESIVTGKPQFWGEFIQVPIDPSCSYGQVQGIAPAWLTVVDVDNGLAKFTIDEGNAEIAFD